ncbi:MDR family MFS transporter [Aneurinibacillus tyrosinisolvens]|uniref:MDR family MFS transporter n=1 Tax=Aneurinibacillus tyrosinisolvens TaxID=1443435 RepID=UPI00063EDFC5|nr:MDR family MFS transporter [Aneurinibacillus tyrosinisolvens]
MKKINRRTVTVAMMVATVLAAIESTIVSTAMPTIVSELGGLQLISWVVAVYLLTSAVTTPIYGKLADLFGRKIIFTVGAILFLLGSMLSGMAHSMTELIWFRAFQGIGAGAILPITFTIIGDIYTHEERAKIQGVFSGIWGISGILGPLAGGFLVDYVSWRWIFYINIPFGIVAIIMLWTSLHETVEKKRKYVDYPGVLSFTIGMTALLYALLTGGTQYSWSSNTIISLFLLSAISLCLFLYIQTKSPDPMLPLSLFRIRVIAISNLAGFLVSAILIAITVYLPLWIQGVYGQGATNSGLTLIPLSIGWPIGAAVGGRIMVKLGGKMTSCMGTSALFIGSLVLGFIGNDTPHWVLTSAMFVMGLGFGFAITTFTVSVQSAVSWQLRGAATASSTFLRTLGQTVGIAVFGTLFNHKIAEYLSAHQNVLKQGMDMNKLFNPHLSRNISEKALEVMREAIAVGLHQIFLLVLGLSIIGLVVCMALPRKVC